MVVHLGKLEPGLGMDAKNVPPAIDAPVPMSGRSSITTVPTNKQILLQLQMKFPQVPQKLLTSIIDSYVELQRPLHESWSNGLAGATTENSAQNGQFGSDGHHIQHPNPNRRRRENGTEGAATGCAHNIKADANPPKKRRRGRVDDSAGNQTANAGTRACVSAHLNKSYDERLLAQGHPPETGHDATQTNPNTQAIRFYATQDAPDRTAKEHQEYRALLNGCFEKASTRRVGTALKGGTCFNAFIELYTWSLGSTTGCDLDEGDTDQALQCDKTFEDEVLAAKRFLRQKYPNWKSRSPATTEPRVPAQLVHVLYCIACMDEYPETEFVRCRGTKAHPLCRKCFRIMAKSQGEYPEARLRCQNKQDGCSALYLDAQFEFLNQKLLNGKANPLYEPKLYERLRAGEEDDGLAAVLRQCEKCPFCGYYEDYSGCDNVPVFYCRHVNCGKQSCRKCHRKAHEGQTCEQAQQLELETSDRKLREVFHESMTAAVKRTCNHCQAPIQLLDACNKITCVCNHYQCYLCSTSLLPKNFLGSLQEQRKVIYEHFNDSKPQMGANNNKCPLFSNVELLHCRERILSIKATAEKIARNYPQVDRDKLREIKQDLLKKEKGIDAPLVE